MTRNNKVMSGLLVGSLAAWGLSRVVRARQPWYRSIGRTFYRAGKMMEKMGNRLD